MNILPDSEIIHLLAILNHLPKQTTWNLCLSPIDHNPGLLSEAFPYNLALRLCNYCPINSAKSAPYNMRIEYVSCTLINSKLPLKVFRCIMCHILDGLWITLKLQLVYFDSSSTLSNHHFEYFDSNILPML